MTITPRTYLIFKWLLIVAAVFFISSALVVGFYYFIDKKYSGRFFPGVSISGIDISGKTWEEAEKEVNGRIDKISGNGLNFSYYNKQAKLDIISTDSDAVIPVAIFDSSLALESAFSAARSGQKFRDARERMRLWNSGQDFEIEAEVQESRISDFIESNFADYSTPARNASLIVASSSAGKLARFQISEEIKGQKIDTSAAITEVRKRLRRFDTAPIFLAIRPEEPTVYKKDCEGLAEKAMEIVEAAPIRLAYKKKNWQISAEELVPLLELKTGGAASGSVAYVGLNCESSALLLGEKVAKTVDTPAIDAKFEVIDGKVKKFQASQDGVELDREDACRQIETVLGQKQEKAIELATKVLKSATDNQEIDSFGLKEIIGSGHSSFAGSSNNRRHNIRVGAASVNGTLIAPGDEFSLLGVLGEIDAANGYLPELVIKEGRTLPEYGGGLCQIGTTVFRGTVDSGLPVTMRRNHSYRVSYYEPAGTDATIYDPWPDYKFKNDTAHHVLIQSRIEGNDLYFDFWGTPDGRVATNTKPTIYNIVKPGPTKIIETTTLAPKVKKCTESAHSGADAYFDYKVTYPDGRVEDTRFKSHYVPWQAVCLVGVDKAKTEDKATSTPVLKTP